MASRMDRYHKSELVTNARSTKNRDLYKEIDEVQGYSNISGIATIEKTNEIDISKVKEMLKRSETKKRNIDYELKEDIKEEKIDLEETVRNYDINDILIKAKTNEKNNDDKYRSLNESQYELLKNVKQKKNKYDIEKEEAELKELINTIVENKELNEELNDINSLDVGLFDNLKSNTMVGDAASIKKIIEEEKKVNENELEMDNSFYTSSFGFKQSDFEELKTMNHKIKKDNKFIIILLIILILLIVLAGIAVLFLK